MEYELPSREDDSEELANISAKVTVAELLMERGRKLAAEAENDIKFYKLTREIQDR